MGKKLPDSSRGSPVKVNFRLPIAAALELKELAMKSDPRLIECGVLKVKLSNEREIKLSKKKVKQVEHPVAKPHIKKKIEQTEKTPKKPPKLPNRRSNVKERREKKPKASAQESSISPCYPPVNDVNSSQTLWACYEPYSHYSSFAVPSRLDRAIFGVNHASWRDPYESRYIASGGHTLMNPYGMRQDVVQTLSSEETSTASETSDSYQISFDQSNFDTDLLNHSVGEYRRYIPSTQCGEVVQSSLSSDFVSPADQHGLCGNGVSLDTDYVANRIHCLSLQDADRATVDDSDMTGQFDVNSWQSPAVAEELQNNSSNDDAVIQNDDVHSQTRHRNDVVCCGNVHEAASPQFEVGSLHHTSCIELQPILESGSNGMRLDDVATASRDPTNQATRELPVMHSQFEDVTSRSDNNHSVDTSLALTNDTTCLSSTVSSSSVASGGVTTTINPVISAIASVMSNELTEMGHEKHDDIAVGTCLFTPSQRSQDILIPCSPSAHNSHWKMENEGRAAEHAGSTSRQSRLDARPNCRQSTHDGVHVTFVDDSDVATRFVDMSTAFKLAMKMQKSKTKQSSSSNGTHDKIQRNRSRKCPIVNPDVPGFESRTTPPNELNRRHCMRLRQARSCHYDTDSDCCDSITSITVSDDPDSPCDIQIASSGCAPVSTADIDVLESRANVNQPSYECTAVSDANELEDANTAVLESRANVKQPSDECTAVSDANELEDANTAVSECTESDSGLPVTSAEEQKTEECLVPICYPELQGSSKHGDMASGSGSQELPRVVGGSALQTHDSIDLPEEIIDIQEKNACKSTGVDGHSKDPGRSSDIVIKSDGILTRRMKRKLSGSGQED